MAFSKVKSHPNIKSISKIKSQGGVALLTAILIVIMATIISVNVIHGERFSTRKTSHIQTMDRANLYALGLEDWARLFLKKDRKKSKIDSLDEDWAVGIPGLPIEGGYLFGYILDEQAKINLNGLLDSQIAVTRFKRLCDNLEVECGFIPALMDWIDKDLEVRYPDGAEEHYEAYRVANRPMIDVSELILVNGVTPEIYAQLVPHITVLPASAKLNVNTMSTDIYLSLGDNLSAKNFNKVREEEAFSSVDDFITRLELPIDSEGLSVDTNFFRAYGQIVFGEQTVNLVTLLERDSKGNSKILNRTLGQF